MGRAQAQEPVVLIAGLIGSPDLFADVRQQLSGQFGTLAAASDCVAFDFTAYYAAEMGTALARQFLAFARRVQPETLPQIKHATNVLEQQYCRQGKRRVNIDPGYLTLAKLVLASTKDHQHRLYLGEGIFGEVTLRFRNKSFIPWEWTYPDYRTEMAIGFFNRVREAAHREQRRHE